MNNGSIPEIYRILKIGEHTFVPGAVNIPSGLPVGLPVVPALEVETVSRDTDELTAVPVFKSTENRPLRFAKFLVYPVVFLVAFLFFYAIFNFSAIVSQIQGWFTKSQDQQILGNQLSEYYSWIEGYYFSVGDQKLLDPNNDIDKDGLANMDEFIMRTNPTLADSDSDGFSDGIEVIDNTNLWGGGPMTPAQRKLANSLDLIRINNRISFNSLQSLPSTALGFEKGVLGASTISYDLEKPGTLSIPKLSIQTPLIWSKDPKDFDKDLTRGVIHYPGTAAPGGQGVMYVSGHSSDYLWKNHPYKQIFAKLNFLKPGDDIFVSITGADGKLYSYRYQVIGGNIYSADDQAQFIDNNGSFLNLSTCWPIGTQKSRYVVRTVLVGL